MFRFSLNLTFGLSESEKSSYDLPERGKMTDWISDLAKKAKEKHGAQRQEDERFNTEQRIKKELGEKYWGDLLTRLREMAEIFNTTYEASAAVIKTNQINHCEIVVAFNSRLSKKATVTFSPTTHRITWTDHQIANRDPLTREKAEIEFYLDLVGDHAVFAKYGTEVFNPSEVAVRIMEPLLKT
jgi:hypothetical protein